MADPREQLLSTIIDAADGLVAYVGADERFVVMNRHYERWFQRPRHELLGQHVRDALGPETYRRIQPRVQAALRGELVEFENHVRYPDATRWSHVRYVPDIDANGTVRGFVTYVTDVTARHEASESARFQRERLHLISELSAELLATRAPQQLLKSFLPRVAEQIGAEMFFNFLRREDTAILHLNAASGITDQVAQSLAELPFGEAICGRVAATGQPIVVEHVQSSSDPMTSLVKPLGARTYVCFPLTHEARLIGTLSVASTSRERFTPDELEYVRLVARTVSIGLGRAEAEHKLASANAALDAEVARRTARLEEAVHELEGFSYSITHDMRAPLRAMQNFAHILQEEAGTTLLPAHRDYLRRIVAAGHRLDRLIRDTLAYSKILRAELVLEPVDVGGLVHGIIETYPDLQPHQSRIAIAPDIPRVMANEAALTQSLANFLTNAVKFVGPGQQPQIRLWGERSDERVRIFCEDEGIGIPPEHAERIFGLFQRLDRHYEGTGVGLSIARKAAERMGGSVGVENAVGAGSRFWIELRAAP